jgi:FtsP/CotA-like multicopper oxidase with cupredoxin domain
MVLQQLGPALNLLTTPAPNASRQGTQVGAGIFVNGIIEPVVTMRPGQVQLWRMINACHQAGIEFTEIRPAAGASAAAAPAFVWKQTAQDGVQYHWNNFAAPVNRNRKIVLSPANRADILLQAPSAPGTYQVMINFVPLFPGLPQLVLLNIHVEGEAIQPAMGFPATAADFPAFPESLADIDPASIHVRRDISFETVGFRGNGQGGGPFGRAPFPGIRGSRHTIDGAQFQNNVVNQTMVLDTAEEWTLINTTRIPQVPPPPPEPGKPVPAPTVAPFAPFPHPFHIHINPFQVVEIFDPVTMDEPQVMEKDFVWYDTIGIPPAYDYYPNGKPRLGKNGKQTFVNGYVKIRSRFADFTGLFVLHCHILAHEDRGMMQLVQVVPNKTTVEHYH